MAHNHKHTFPAEEMRAPVVAPRGVLCGFNHPVLEEILKEHGLTILKGSQVTTGTTANKTKRETQWKAAEDAGYETSGRGISYNLHRLEFCPFCQWLPPTHPGFGKQIREVMEKPVVERGFYLWNEDKGDHMQMEQHCTHCHVGGYVSSRVRSQGPGESRAKKPRM